MCSFICIKTECYVIIASDHNVIFDKHTNFFNIQFHVTVSENNCIIYFIFSMYIQIVGHPRLCNSTLLGITKDNLLLNGTEIKHTHKDIMCFSSEHCQSVTVNYTVSNIDPLMNYIFIADILDHFNDSKTKNESYFSEYSILN